MCAVPCTPFDMSNVKLSFLDGINGQKDRMLRKTVKNERICKEITKFGIYISSESPSSDESNEPLCNLKIFCVTSNERFKK